MTAPCTCAPCKRHPTPRTIVLQVNGKEIRRVVLDHVNRQAES